MNYSNVRKKFAVVLYAVATIGLCFCLASCGAAKSWDDMTAAEKAVDEAKEYQIHLEQSEVADVINIHDITLPAGSDEKDIQRQFSYESGDMKRIYYDLDDVDFDIPGEYTATCHAVVPISVGNKILSPRSVSASYSGINMAVEFKIKITSS